MSTLTLADVLAADAAPVHRTALAWAALARDLDHAHEQFLPGLRKVDRASGDAAVAAVQRLTVQGDRLANAVNPARRIADALDRHAYGLDDLRRMLDAIGVEARGHGLTLDPTGRVLAPTTSPGAPGWGPAMSRLLTDLDEVLARARALDDQTAATIRASIPWPGDDGWGDGATAPFVARGVVAGQRGRPPAEVRAWWAGLTPEQRDQVIRDDADLVGWLDGIPATDRDRANRIMLDRLLAERPGEDGAGLRAVRDKLSQLGGDALLLGISATGPDGKGDGRVVIALGDPDTARHTAVFVPGVNTDLLDVGGDMDRARNLRDAADLMTPASKDVSVIYWLGYDAPETFGALRQGPSEEGGRAFTPFVDGLRATHQPGAGAQHVTAVGHSYGSTVIAESALSGGLRVDDIVTAGSPGMHTGHARDLHIDPRHVWGGVADDDPVGGWGGSIWGVHGNEPTDADFGANRYVVDTAGHSAYWTPQSESLVNQAYVVVSQYQRVSLEHGNPPPS